MTIRWKAVEQYFAVVLFGFYVWKIYLSGAKGSMHDTIFNETIKGKTYIVSLKR